MGGIRIKGRLFGPSFTHTGLIIKLNLGGCATHRGLCVDGKSAVVTWMCMYSCACEVLGV